MKNILIIGAVVILIIINAMIFGKKKNTQDNPIIKNTTQSLETKNAYFAGGCFWCMEGIFEGQEGVVEAIAGYIGGTEETATYSEVSGGGTLHREGVKVVYNPSKISYKKLVELFWTQIDPTDEGGQFADRGYQYTTAIYYDGKEEKIIAEASKKSLGDSGKFDIAIATKVASLDPFYPAESYHQNYYKKSALRYNLYAKGSGRKKFIKENWEEKVEELTQDTSPQSSPSQREEEATDSIPLLDKEGLGEVGTSTSPDIGKRLEETYSDASLRKRLTPLQYKVTQEDGTEPSFNNEYWDNHEDGIYVDIIDGTALYSSLDKFDSGTGWPSFTKAISEDNVKTSTDTRFFITRTEVSSLTSDAHLGHIFNDAPKELGGIRHCINSASLRFVPLDEMKDEGYEEYLKLFEQ